MKICVIGAGYVGLTTAAVLSSLGHQVSCADKNVLKISELNNGHVPIQEHGLDQLIENNKKAGRLSFTEDVHRAIKESKIVMIAVGTPPDGDGVPDLAAVEEVVESLSKSLNSHHLIITKSTVPPGTNEWIEQSLLKKKVDHSLFDVVSNPEFLREGTAVEDTLHPNKIVVGTKNPKTLETIRSLYSGIDVPYILSNFEGAEMIKYASNAFLATKISFANEMARICDACGANINDVVQAIGIDPRIGPDFLSSGLGYGGSCLPKDVAALEHVALSHGVIPMMLHAGKNINDSQIDLYLNKLKQELGSLKEKRVTVWGLSFKANTDDIRFSPSIKLIEKLIDCHCHVQTYDPMASEFESLSIRFDDIYDSLDRSDALIVATNWPQFNAVNWGTVKQRLNGNVILDARNCLDPKDIRSAGLRYTGVAVQ